MSCSVFLRSAVAVLLSLTFTSVMAQLEDVSLDHLVEASTVSSWFGAGLSTADFNLDGWDDVTVSSSDGTVKLYSGGPDGLGLHQILTHGNEAKAVLWVDIDNDGDLDLFAGVYNEGVYLYVRHADGLLHLESEARGIPLIEGWDVRGISARDYDEDLDLDIYICSYHDATSEVAQENILLQNDGSGHFTDVTETAGVGNGLMHSFQGTWFDWDDDGDDDLWVINDRSIYPNALYRNLGNGTFYDVSEDVGANIGIEAMSATAFDPDNDGDWDMYCTNIENNPNVFLRNDNGVYVDVTSNAGIASMQYGWGACAVDLNGDMLEDLMVATYRFPNSNPYDNHLYVNTGQGTFIDMIEDWPNEQYQLYGLGRFDLNGDHCPDIVGHGNAAHAQILLNTNPEEASRVAVKLVGTESNAQAVGAEIHMYAGGTHQMRQVSAGCDYMTQHTHTQFFGLGTETLIDSLIIEWPAGLTEQYHNLPVDTLFTFVEGLEGAALQAHAQSCAWSAQVWELPFPSEEVAMTWNGEPVDAPHVVADSSGTYVLEATWWGLYSWSQTVVVNIAESPTAEWTLVPPLCHGEAGMLAWASDEAQSVALLGDTLGPSGEGLMLPAGSYTWVWVYGEGCEVQATVDVVEPSPISVSSALEMPACAGETGAIEVVVSGGTEPHLLNWHGSDPGALLPGTLTLSVSDANGCLDTLVLEVTEPLPLESSLEVSHPVPGDSAWVSLEIAGGTSPYDILWTAGVWDNGWTAAPGIIGWVVEDANGCLSVGAADIAENPLSDLSEAGWPDPAPVREGGMITWSGPTCGLVSVRVFDRLGRVLVTAANPGHALVVGTTGPCIIEAIFTDGSVRRWKR